MKKKLLCALILLLLFFLTPRIFAEGEYNDDFRNAVELDDSLLSEEVDLNNPDSLMSDLTPSNFFAFFAEQFKGAAKDTVKNLITGLSLVIISVLVNRCSSNLKNQNLQFLFSFMVSISMVMICHSGLTACAGALQKSIENMKIFTTACVPSFTVVMMAAGEGGGASVFSASMVLFGEIGTLISEQILMPLTDVYLSIGICAVISDEYNFSAIGKNIRRFLIWVIGIAMVAFRTLLKLQSNIATAGDRLTQKAIRAAVGGLVPAVGNTLTQGVDGLFTVASGVKVSFAVAAVLIVLSIMAPALIKIGVYGLSWSICRWVADFMNDTTVRSIAEVLANCYYLMLAIGGFVALMGLFSFFGVMVQVS